MKLFSPGAKRKELNTPYFLANPGLDTPKTSISKLNSNHPAYQDFQVSGRKNGHLQEIWCKEQTARQTWNTWLHLHDSTKSGPNYGQLSGIYLGDHDMFGASCPPTLNKKSFTLSGVKTIENNHIQTNKDVKAFFLRKKTLIAQMTLKVCNRQ